MSQLNTRNPLILRSQREAMSLASSMISRSIDAAAPELEEQERIARSSARRKRLAGALSALLRQRAYLANGYSQSIERAINEDLVNSEQNADGSPSARPERKVATNAPDFGFTIIEDEEMARFVESSRLQQTAMPVVEEVLTQLDSLMSSALGLPVVRADLNPLRPDIICGALLELIDSVDEPSEIRSTWIRYLSKPFAGELKRLYEHVLKLLQGQGVEAARYRVRLAVVGGSGGGGGGGAAAAAAAEAAAAAQQQAAMMTMHGALPGGMPPGAMPMPPMPPGAFPVLAMPDLAQIQAPAAQALMQDFLYQQQWVNEHDQALSADYYAAVQAQMAQAMQEAEEVQWSESTFNMQRSLDEAMSVIERPSRALHAGMALPPQLWGEMALPAARMRTLMELKAKAQKLSQALGLSAVRMLIDQVAGDERVLPAVREAFIALEPALLRMAMADPRFFGDDAHPARRLIEDIAQRSFKYNDVYSEEFERFMAPVRDAVCQLDETDPISEHDFNDRLQALQMRWQAEDSVEQKAGEEGLDYIRFAQERQALADQISSELSMRSDIHDAPAIVVDFLYKDWSLVIAHAHLTDKRGQFDPGGYLAAVTDLLWSVNIDAVLKAPARLFEIAPQLIKTLREGLNMLGKAPEETEAFFGELIRYHAPVLKLRRAARNAAADSGNSGLLTSSQVAELLPARDETPPAERPQPRKNEQPWMRRDELAAAGFDEDFDSPSALAALRAKGEAALAAAETKAEPIETDFERTEVMEKTDLPDGGAEQEKHLAEKQQAEAEKAAQESAQAPEQAAEGATTTQEAAAAPPPAAPAPVSQQPAEEDPDQVAEARLLLERLRAGDWVDLNVSGKWRRARLNWCSDNGALFMFISHGGRPHSMTRRTCEKLIRTRHLRMVEAGEVVEEAVRKISRRSKSAKGPNSVH